MTPEIHLTPRRPILRSQTDTRAFPLNETNMPKGDGTVEGIRRILDWLDVEKSNRYRPTGTQTFCNIYAYDYAYLMGCYLPRVWWTDKALKELDFDKPSYGKNLVELNANALYDWFPRRGGAFGWKEINSTQAQQAANQGKCVIMVASNLNRARSGHIVAIVPQTKEVLPVMGTSIVIYPVQSQAGRINRKYFASNWWSSGHNRERIYVCEK